MPHSSMSTSLPAELWLHIFEDLTTQRFPMKDLDYKLLRSRNSFRICRKLCGSQPWIAGSLLHVCKSWHASIKPLLYNTVFLRKASQVKALASLLRRNNTPRPKDPDIGSWVKRIVIMINDPNDRISAYEFGDLMSFCHNLAALHIPRYLPDESTVYLYPDPHAIFRHISLTGPTLRILNLGNCISQRISMTLPMGFFQEMVALRAFRCDSKIVVYNLQPLDYLSVETWSLNGLEHENLSIKELFIQDIPFMSFPLSYSAPEHLSRLDLDITSTLPCSKWEIEDVEEGGMANQTVDDPDSDPESMPSLGGVSDETSNDSDSDSDSEGGDGVGTFPPISDRGDLQKGALDVLPPSVTYLHLVCRSWESLRGSIQRLPESVTCLGLEPINKPHCEDKSYRHLMHILREIIAPGLAVVQLNHWQSCVDLRTRHAGLLKEVVDILKNRNVELWDAEGAVMMTNTIP
ncbi:hypothetical protein ONZ45_g18853 [Pleurotus djamor]|nr:hypothetical protein ONZ45_g18853 [Pleurotus djamor]